MKILITVSAMALLFAPAPSRAQAINDAQIASVVVTANQVDIDAGKLAHTTSTNADVKKFAQLMIDDHTGVNKSATELVTRLKVTPEDNPTSQALSNGAAAELAKLAALDGAAFDKAYVSNEVAFHGTVNGALKSTLIPSADNPQLKSLLETGLTLFTEHQHHAEHLASELK